MARLMLSMVVVCAFCSVAWAQTFVSGLIDSDTTWTTGGSPYVLDGDVEVAGGATLAIEAGVLVEGRAGTKLIVGGEAAGDVGTLQALGRLGQGIRFDSRVRGEPWGGILFRETTVEPEFGPGGEFVRGSILQFCRLERADEPIVMLGAVAYLSSATVIGPGVPLGSGVRVELREELTLKSFRADGLEVDGSLGHGLFVNGGTGHLLTDSTFSNNIQGAFVVSSSRGDGLRTTRLQRCTFSQNGSDGTPVRNGAGLVLATFGDAELVDCTFSFNEAVVSGGAVWGSAETLVLTRCEFNRNQAGQAGGASAISGNIATTFEDCAFIENSAGEWGGAISKTGASTNGLVIRRSRFQGNEAAIGGGVLVRQDATRIEHSEFVGNASAIDGGAVRFSLCRRVILDSNQFHDNSSAGLGGAISFNSVRARDGVDLLGNVFSGNIARLGGAIYTTEARDDDSVFRLAERNGLNNSFDGNTAQLGDDIYHASPVDVDATGVCWGTSVPVAIGSRIYDGRDEPGLGIVWFDPVAPDCEDCRVDLDGDGALTLFDYLAFGGLFGLGDLQADFDGDGVLTIFDFLIYQTEFDAGCDV